MPPAPARARALAMRKTILPQCLESWEVLCLVVMLSSVFKGRHGSYR